MTSYQDETKPEVDFDEVYWTIISNNAHNHSNHSTSSTKYKDGWNILRDANGEICNKVTNFNYGNFGFAYKKMDCIFYDPDRLVPDGTILRKVYLPKNHSKLYTFPVTYGYRTNMLYLDETYDLTDIRIYDKLDLLNNKDNFLEGCLKWACSKGLVDIVNFLISKNVNMCSEKENRYSLTHNAFNLACVHGHLEIVKLLISNGYDTNKHFSSYLFEETCKNGHVDIISFLLDMCKKNKYDNSCVKWLIDQGFVLAVKNNKLPMVKFLVENGAEKTHYGLKLASKLGFLDLVKFFIETGVADVHADDDCSIKWAAIENHPDVVRYLTDHGANVNSDEGYALRWMSCYGNLEMVKYLVEKGAKFSNMNDRTMTWAVENKHTKIVEFLNTILEEQNKMKQIETKPIETQPAENKVTNKIVIKLSVTIN